MVKLRRTWEVEREKKSDDGHCAGVEAELFWHAENRHGAEESMAATPTPASKLLPLTVPAPWSR
jgi:hypothetical protein